MGIHRSPVDSHHKGQWRGASMFSLISAWTNGWENNRNTGDLRRHRAHDDITVMCMFVIETMVNSFARRRFEWNFRWITFMLIYWLLAVVSLLKLPSDEFHWTSQMIKMINQHWFRLGANRQQSITWANFPGYTVLLYACVIDNYMYIRQDARFTDHKTIY